MRPGSGEIPTPSGSDDKGESGTGTDTPVTPGGSSGSGESSEVTPGGSGSGGSSSHSGNPESGSGSSSGQPGMGGDEEIPGGTTTQENEPDNPGTEVTPAPEPTPELPRQDESDNSIITQIVGNGAYFYLRDGESTELQCVLSPENATEKITWTINEPNYGLILETKGRNDENAVITNNGGSGLVVVSATSKNCWWNFEVNLINTQPSTSGILSGGITWRVQGDTLYFDGIGAIGDQRENDNPWMYYYDNIQHVEFSTGITSIGKGTLYGLHNVRELTIPEGVTHIDDRAFYYMQYLTLHLPSSLKSVGTEAFWGCVPSYLSQPFPTIYYNGTKAQWDQIQFGEGNYLELCTIHTSDWNQYPF